MPLIIEWSEKKIHSLVNEKRRRNSDYYRVFGKLKVRFWNEVAEKVKKETGTDFTEI